MIGQDTREVIHPSGVVDMAKLLAEVGIPIHQHDELAYMGTIDWLLSRLTKAERARALAWLTSKHGYHNE